MNSAKMVCIKCGQEGELYDFLCKNCYLSKKVMLALPPYLDMYICSICGSVRCGTEWQVQEQFEQAVHKTVVKTLEKSSNIKWFDCKLEFGKSYEQSLLKVRIDFSTDKLSATIFLNTKLRLKKLVCEKCSRLHGGYYEAILQVRATKRDLNANELAEIEKFMEVQLSIAKKAFVSKQEYRDGGVDFYVSDKKIAKTIAQKLSKYFGAVFKQSAKLHTRKGGKNIYRVTYLVRLEE